VPASAAAPSGSRLVRAWHLAHPLGVAREHLDVGEQVVRERHRLRDLQVGEAGQDRLGVLLGELDEGALQLGEERADAGDLVAQPQAHVGRDLVVARAPGVQALAGVAGELIERASMLRCTSSSSARHWKGPASISAAIVASPDLIAPRSAAEITPCAASMVACARLPARSARHRRRSKATLDV
jgi:hypothetical protein